MSTYLRPSSLPAALEILGAGDRVVLSGGTDVYPACAGDRRLRGEVLDISAIEELRGIDIEPDHVRFGAATTWADIVRADLPSCCDGLRAAAREVGSIQIQNAGTIGGNLCNASPAADGVPPLLTLDASVEIASTAGRRALPLAGFITGYRSTALASGELLTAVVVPTAPGGVGTAASSFVKLGSRHSLVISIAMVAALVQVVAGRIRTARIAVGACSPVAVRLAGLEASLLGVPADGGVAELVHEHPFEELSPIADVRASAEYRREVAPTLVVDAISRCGVG